MKSVGLNWGKLVSEPETPEIPQRTAFVVWLGRDADGHIEGVVERARTGEKHRFQGLEELGPLIGRMTEAGTPAPLPRPDEPEQ